MSRTVRPRRVSYAALRERLHASGLPWDNEAERAAIGAVLLAPNGHSRRLVRRAYAGHFYDPGHGWLWEQFGTAFREKMDLDIECFMWLMEHRRIARTYYEKFGGRLSAELRHCIEPGF